MVIRSYYYSKLFSKDLSIVLDKIKNLGNVNIVETKHFLKNARRDYCGHDLTYILLKNYDFVNVEVQEDNKFKLFYHHPEMINII